MTGLDDLQRFEFMLEAQARVFSPRDRDGFACQFNIYHFAFGETPRVAIDNAMKEYAALVAEQSKKES